VINPGEKAVIQLTYNPFGQPGTIYTRAFVYVSISEKKPIAALTISGKVTPSSALWRDYRYTMGHLKIRAKTINMGTVIWSMWSRGALALSKRLWTTSTPLGRSPERWRR
jgi:hypothetical protein